MALTNSEVVVYSIINSYMHGNHICTELYLHVIALFNGWTCPAAGWNVHDSLNCCVQEVGVLE